MVWEGANAECMAARTRLAETASATMSGKRMGVGVGLAVAVGAGAAVSAADEQVFARASANRIKQSLFFMGWRRRTVNARKLGAVIRG